MTRLLALAALCASTVLASPLNKRNLELPYPEPCALVADAIAIQDGPAYKVDGNLALSCLRTVPLDKDNSTAMVKAFRAFANYQSDLAHLKQGLPGALYPPSDLLGGIDDVLDKLAKDHYNNEYDLHSDLYAISKAAHNFHTNYQVDIVTTFRWSRSDALVSLSSNGSSLPEIYLYSDAQLLSKSDAKVSPISQINGVDVETWINGVAGISPYDHDPDANYNSMMWQGDWLDPTAVDSSLFAETLIPQGNDTLLTFVNGVVDGATFFDKYCRGVDKTTLTAANTTTNASSISSTTLPTLVSFTSVAAQSTYTPLSTTFPKPYVITKDFSLAGYLPDDLSDVVVLQTPSFDPNQGGVSDLNYYNYLNAIRSLLATAQAQGRKKLIIDLRRNGGGSPVLAFDLLKRIVADVVIYSATQRSTPLSRQLCDTLHDTFNKTGEPQPVDLSVYSVDTRVDKDGNRFASTASFYGPFQSFGDNYTAQARLNVADLPMSYAPEPPLPRIFDPKDTILFLDGMCGSACAIFAEMAKSQAKIKSIVVGGRKQNGPMQGVGGTKGAEVYTLATFVGHLNATITRANSTAQARLLELSSDFQGSGTMTLFSRSFEGQGVRMNMQNNIRINDSTITPLHYIYEAADCRFFYTAGMLMNQALSWKRVYDIAWRNGTCVPGSADHPSSLSGKLHSYVDAYPPVGANYTFGAPASAWPKGITNYASTNVTRPSAVMAPSSGKSLMATGTTYLGEDATTTSSSTPTTTTTTTPTTTPAPSTTTATSGAVRRMVVSGTAGFAAIAAMLLLYQTVM
ncbi:hypothetical protein AMS68_003215 [Peltaster fructicola]|uniref:Uncharacterized protein n=1 Tax=Peltaster fructicola TaxID=286661 RepID=A0A6H0XSV5_9PEZI|nr:hypothetical protein AMS68_003215 [Peltaster fructicola]